MSLLFSSQKEQKISFRSFSLYVKTDDADLISSFCSLTFVYSDAHVKTAVAHNDFHRLLLL